MKGKIECACSFLCLLFMRYFHIAVFVAAPASTRECWKYDLIFDMNLTRKIILWPCIHHIHAHAHTHTNTLVYRKNNSAQKLASRDFWIAVCWEINTSAEQTGTVCAYFIGTHIFFCISFHKHMAWLRASRWHFSCWNTFYVYCTQHIVGVQSIVQY